MAQTKEENEAPLLFHLEALRKVLLKSFIALGIGFIPIFFLTPFFLHFFSEEIVAEGNWTLHYFSPMEVFFLQIKMAALFDVVLCSPYIAWQVWGFVLPALYENEKRLLRRFAFLSSSLFFAGVIFCLFLCFPLIIRFGASFATESIQPVFGVSNILTLAMWLSLAFGAMFQFPLLTYSLIASGIVSYRSVCEKRAYVAVFVLLISAFLTPPDVVSQLLLGIPTYLLFEMGLLLARRYRNRESSEKENPNLKGAPNFHEKNFNSDESSSQNKNSPENFSEMRSEKNFMAVKSRYQAASYKESEQQKPM